MAVGTTKNNRYQGPNPLDNPPPFHQKLLDYGERPYWSPDGKRIVFVESNYGDICEIDLETRQVKNLTKNLGEHHSFLRVLFLPNGDYLLIGPKEFKDRDISRHVESELWIMDKDAKLPPKPLGRRIYEGCAVSTSANRIAYALSSRTTPEIGGTDQWEAHVTEIVYDEDGPRLGEDKVIYRTSAGHQCEPQDFRHNDKEVIMAEYKYWRSTRPDEWKCVVKGVNVDTLEVQTYISEPTTHNECEGIFPDGKYICLESSCDYENFFPPVDLWKLKLDGSGQRVRMTQLIDHPPWRASNSNVSPDGKWLAFMINVYDSEPGYGMGMGLLDLEAWGKSERAEKWETPEERAEQRNKNAAS
jgi:hypothetical protein